LIAVTPAIATADDPITALETQQQAIFDKLVPSVVFIANESAMGSGFFVDSEGLILTSDHVVGPKQSVTVVTSDGKRYLGAVVERAAGDVDLALLRIPASHTPALTLAAQPEIRVGSWVAAVGHGGKSGTHTLWSFNAGMVSNIYSIGGERPVFQTQIPLNPGNSGGPIVARNGHVVGIVTAGILDANNINFAIRSEVALRALALLAERAAVLVVRAPAGVAVFVDGRMAGTGPRVVVPAEARTYEVFAVIGGAMKKVQVTYPAERTVELK
jgi:S1-C subfamily serine protease